MGVVDALAYARKFVYFWAQSPISGRFDETRYKFLTAPLLKLSDIHCKSHVQYGPSQSLKTVLLQIATAYRLDISRKSVLAVAQTDDDVKSMALVKMIPFLRRIWALTETTKDDRSAQTIAQWLWAAHELIMSGPGENAQNSKSVCFLHTDEAHLWCVAYPGALTALTGRMGDRWDRAALHATTAADIGTEIDLLYVQGQQDEWHVQCIHCDKLIWPLWEESARKHYNGERVFHWDDSQSETETLDSIRIICPHCQKPIEDTPRNRLDMDQGAQYVAMNPSAGREVASFRWNCFAPRWKAWRSLLATYLNALKSAKLGELKPYEEWVKKYEVRSWDGEYPMLGDSTRDRGYKSAQIEVVETELRTGSVDVQEKGGFHLWAECAQWKRTGDSKRIAYDKLASWDDLRAWQQRNGIKDPSPQDHQPKMGVDFGARDREVFAACEKYRWLALKSGDEDGFAHPVVHPVTHVVSYVNLPYSVNRLESCNVGRETQKHIRLPRGGKCPAGFCLAKLWSLPRIYPVLYALKQGTTGREFGIPDDINTAYISQLHSYAPGDDKDRKTGVVKKIIWRQVRQEDHAFACAAQSIVLAMVNGFFPLETLHQTQPVAA